MPDTMKTITHVSLLLLPFFLASRTAGAVPVSADCQFHQQCYPLRVADAPEVRDALVKLDIWLEGQRLRYDLPGFSVGVVHDQELIWSKGYGFADLTNKIPATDQTLYRVASITKTFTATAVMQLVEQGKLSLEDPVSQHLPWFKPKDADPARPVLVWHLLSHTGVSSAKRLGPTGTRLEGPDISNVKSVTADTPLSRCRRRHGSSIPTTASQSPENWWPKFPRPLPALRAGADSPASGA